MKKLLLALFTVALIASAGCLQTGFDAEYKQLKEVKARFLEEAQFLPNSEKKLDLMYEDLSTLEQQVKERAVKELIQIEKTKLEMQLNFVKANNNLQGINLSEPDCEKLGQALSRLGRAVQKGNQALESMKEFQKSHPSKFMKAGLERNRLQEYILSIQNTQAYVKNLNQVAC